MWSLTKVDGIVITEDCPGNTLINYLLLSDDYIMLHTVVFPSVVRVDEGMGRGVEGMR